MNTGSFDSSGGAFPDGYCVWELVNGGDHTVVAVHCREGYVPGDGPQTAEPDYDGQLVKWPCDVPG